MPEHENFSDHKRVSRNGKCGKWHLIKLKPLTVNDKNKLEKKRDRFGDRF